MSVFLIFLFVPILFLLYISFHSWHILRGTSWVGIGNYVALIKDFLFLKSLKITLLYSLMTVPFLVTLSLLVALLLNSVIKFKNFFKGILFMPVICSMIIAALIWKWIYHGNYGVFNYILSIIGIKGPYWLGDTTYALPAVAILAIWKGIGYYMILYLAGLTGIPNQLYEAARVDGASKWDSFWRITLPLLKPTTLLVIVVATIYSFQVFDSVYVMTYGGPANATNTLVWFIYMRGFVEYRLGMAGTAGFFLFLIIFLASMIELKLIRFRELY